MLTRDQVAAMTDTELAVARRGIHDRLVLNDKCQRYASGVVCKATRGGSKVRARRVAKTDWRRMDSLRREAGEIRAEAALLDAEIGRRANAEEARA